MILMFVNTFFVLGTLLFSLPELSHILNIVLWIVKYVVNVGSAVLPTKVTTEVGYPV